MTEPDRSLELWREHARREWLADQERDTTKPVTADQQERHDER